MSTLLCILLYLASGILGFLLGSLWRDNRKNSISREKYDLLQKDHYELQEAFEDFKNGAGERNRENIELKGQMASLKDQLTALKAKNPTHDISAKDEELSALNNELEALRIQHDQLLQKHTQPETHKLASLEARNKKLKKRNKKLKKRYKKVDKKVVREVEISKTINLSKLQKMIRAGKLLTTKRKVKEKKFKNSDQ